MLLEDEVEMVAVAVAEVDWRRGYWCWTGGKVICLLAEIDSPRLQNSFSSEINERRGERVASSV